MLWGGEAQPVHTQPRKLTKANFSTYKYILSFAFSLSCVLGDLITFANNFHWVIRRRHAWEEDLPDDSHTTVELDVKEDGHSFTVAQ